MLIDRQIAQEQLHLVRSGEQVLPRPHSVKTHIAPDPVTISLFDSNRVVLHPQHFAHLAHQLELGIGNHQFPTFGWPAPRGHYLFYLPTLLHGGYSYNMIRAVASNSAFMGQYALRPKSFRLNK